MNRRTFLALLGASGALALTDEPRRAYSFIWAPPEPRIVFLRNPVMRVYDGPMPLDADAPMWGESSMLAEVDLHGATELGLYGHGAGYIERTGTASFLRLYGSDGQVVAQFSADEVLGARASRCFLAGGEVRITDVRVSTGELRAFT